MLNRPGIPLFATINITGVCNLSCGYCFYQPRSHETMSWENFKKTVDELSNLSVFFINISGGEPFTHPEIDRFIRYAHEKFQHVVLLTNGTLLLPQHIDTIRSIIQSKGSFPIQVSIDSIVPDVNIMTRCDSTKILENIKTLSELKANIVIAMVITRFNVDNIIDSIIQLSKFTRFFHLMPFQTVKAMKGTDKKFELSQDELKAFWNEVRLIREKHGLHIDTPIDDINSDTGCASGAPCMAAFSQFVIEPNMKVRPCDRLTEITIGDLKVSSVAHIWNSEPAINILNRKTPLCKV